jgi:signal transduction histidine kinase
MKNRPYGIVTKCAAFILFLLLLLAAFWSLLGAAYVTREGYYSGGYSYYRTELCERVTRDNADSVFSSYYDLVWNNSSTPDLAGKLEQLNADFSREHPNFLYTITNESGSVLLSNFEGQSYGLEKAYAFDMESGVYRVTCHVRDPIDNSDNYSQSYGVYTTLYSLRYTLIVMASATLLLMLCLFIYLMFAAGRRNDSDEVKTTWQHAIPLDLLAAALIFFLYLIYEACQRVNLFWSVEYGLMIMLPVSLLLFAVSAPVLAFLMNLAVRIKKGKWWRNTIVYRILKLIATVVRKVFMKLPLVWKAALLGAGYILVNIVLMFVSWAEDSPGGVLVWLLFNLAVYAALCFLLIQMKTLCRAGARIAGGDYAGRIDTKNMVWEFRRHAENLNNITSGMSKAVEERLKSERLKTELITNVSHDLKTPLTSIINYIDLLKKEDLKSDTAGEYVAVLDRQSSRLKKLTEDLLEASKAATGNISVNFGRTDLVELLNQSLGEYAGRFEAGRLEPVFKTGREQAFISADGRLLWRVFDNLLNNIIKYSLPGTRVYITLDAEGGDTRITLLNISGTPLNIAADELMERFVRGDASRSTDGSGLGLSIARSLTELQGGRFELIIEGDLFKTLLTFKTLQE